MALIKCSKCGNQYSNTAPSCPHCRPSSGKKIPIGLILTIISLSCLGYAIYYKLRSKPDAVQKRVAPKDMYGSKTYAWIIAQKIVKGKLQAPATARFPEFSNSGVGAKKYNERTWHVWGHVDSQNSSGVLKRDNWETYLQKEPGSDRWTSKYLRIANREFGINPKTTEPQAVKAAQYKAEQARRNKKAQRQVLQYEAEEARLAEAAQRKAEQDILWREARYQQLLRTYRNGFKDKTGQQLTLALKSGGKLKGRLKEVKDEAVVLAVGQGTMDVPKKNLSNRSRIMCYRDDFAEYRAQAQLQKEIKTRP